MKDESVPDNFDGSSFQNKAAGFEDPVQLPSNGATARQWQDANRSWWEKTPMRYDWRESIGSQPGTKPYYDEIDRRFLESVRQYLPWKRSPFESLIPYSDLDHLDALEIGVGQGTHAQLIALHSKSFTGIDLTQAACISTQKRFKLAGIDGRILQMDAEAMSFPDNSFDFIWSWGVIHHSSNTQNVLREMHRVLRPGGHATVMVYYRSFIQYYLINGIARGLLRREFWKTGGIHQINQAATDGALARFFTVDDFSKLLGSLFVIERVGITGQKPDAIPLPNGRLKTFLIRHIPDAITRFVTDRLRLGLFLIVRIRKA
jgi:2-polyprenyl-3-methyl-5-hydroxy-6-metoxy-1,4-benzoquinol methylase